MRLAVAIAAAVLIGGSEAPTPDDEHPSVPLPGGATLLLPAAESGPVDLVVHLHGATSALRRAMVESGRPVAVVVVNENGLSSAYAKPFSDPSRFPGLLDDAVAALAEHRPGLDPGAGRLIVGAFSAGFGGVRELLKQPEAFDRIDAVVLADALYCGYEGDPSVRRLDPALMRDFRRFAAEAAAGRKAMLVSHSALVPDGYGSTAETADDLIRYVGGSFEPTAEDWGDGWRPSRRFEAGGLVVLGFDGEAGDDHLRHLRRLGALWSRLPGGR